MRLHIKTTASTELVPFNYQSTLVGVMHRWLGQNDWHDGLSLYSLSWLSGGKASGKSGLHFPRGAHLFISAPDNAFIKQLVGGIRSQPELAFGMVVQDLLLQPAPAFGPSHTFFAQSPILIKRHQEDRTKFYFPQDVESDALLTETLHHKLRKGGYATPTARVSFDRSYHRIKTKVATYQGIKNKGTLCPIIVEGSPEEVAFAWEVGAGNSTGIGFGALK